MAQFKICNRLVGDNAPVFIIAEACDNHLGDMTVAKEMIRQSKMAGADAVKFQHHLPDEEMLPDTPTSDNMDEPLYDFLMKYALTLDQHKELKQCCDEVGIQYMCTPFSLKAAQDLHKEGLLDVIKIGSGEMTDIPSLLEMAKFKIPMILSTGMSTFDEIQETYDALLQTGTPFALMNCVSEYPPIYEDINLNVIGKMQKRFGNVIIGHSDHTPTLYTCFAAVALCAKLIEKHIILDKSQPGPDQAVSVDMEEFADLVRGIRIVEAASGSEKNVHKNEQQIRTWAFRSVVSREAIKAGAVITQEMIWSKRPGTGIPSKEMPKIIGKKAIHDIPKNILLKWEDLS